MISEIKNTAEGKRLEQDRNKTKYWKRWGSYLSDRQWGTVREDYSDNGAAWDYFSHDQARSRAYRWGEDGIAGISDNHQNVCFAIALWNEKDPILKERLFGLTNGEGNHCPTGNGEVKEMNLWEVSMELSRRLINIFLKHPDPNPFQPGSKNDWRPVYGGIDKLQNDENWRNLILFYEYFHGDIGAGIGANHQTGWTGLVAKLIQQWGEYPGQNKVGASLTNDSKRPD